MFTYILDEKENQKNAKIRYLKYFKQKLKYFKTKDALLFFEVVKRFKCFFKKTQTLFTF